MVSEGFVQLPGDGAGKKLRTFVLGNGDHAEGVAIVDADGQLAYAPEDPHVAALTTASLAAGASTTLNGVQISSLKSGRLDGVTVAASVPMKAEVYKVASGVPTLIATVFTTEASLTTHWAPPHKAYAAQVGGASCNYRVVITNLDTIDAADVYATIYWDEQ